MLMSIDIGQNTQQLLGTYVTHLL